MSTMVSTTTTKTTMKKSIIGGARRIPSLMLTILLLTIATTTLPTTYAKATTPKATTMPSPTKSDLSFLDDLRSKYSHQPTFLQAVEEMAVALMPLFDESTEEGAFYRRAFLSMAEPERMISFRVSWMDDNGKLQFNRGWRVEFNRYVCTCCCFIG